LPVVEALEYQKKPVLFDYNYLEPDEMEVVYDRGVIRIRSLKDKNFGKISMPDPSNDVFEAFELQIHTPAEHFMKTKKFDLEI